MQQLYAFSFSGAITFLLAVSILYFDYGFWHDRYSRSEDLAPLAVEQAKPEIETISPGAMVSGFFKEVSDRAKEMKANTPRFLEGKEVYSTSESTSTKEKIKTSSSTQ